MKFSIFVSRKTEIKELECSSQFLSVMKKDRAFWSEEEDSLNICLANLKRMLVSTIK